MSAPAEALGRFWADLREKSRVRIENPDLPEELKIAAGNMVGTLWANAQGLAQESLTALRTNANASVQEAEARLREAESFLQIARQEVHTANIAIEEEKLRTRELEQTIAGEAATRLALQAQLVNAQQAAVKHQKAMDDARRDFSSELEKLREALKLTEERYLATESRALLEIDRERTIAAKIQKELKQVRSSATEAADRHRAGIQILQNEIGNLKQRNGNIEGELRAVSISKDILTAELIQERESVRDLSARLTTATNETEVWRQKASDVQLSLDALRQPKQRKSRRHQGTE